MCQTESGANFFEKYLLFKGILIGGSWTLADEKRMMCRYFGKMP